MATEALTMAPWSATSDPSDARLFETTASLLDAMGGPTLRPRLSRLLRYVCSVWCAAEVSEARADRLMIALAEYLRAWRVLRPEQATPAGLDAWAAQVRLVFLHAALVGCARHHRRGGV